MLNKIERGSVPLGGHAAIMGVLPEQFNNRDVNVTYLDGTPGKTCHVSANGQHFNLSRLVGGNNTFSSIVLDEISYTGTDGDVKIFSIKQAEPVPFKSAKPFTLGYVTKLNGLRWGFNFNYDPKTGRGQLVKDPDSPIIGVLFHLVK